jgi:DNA-binding NarL/FixJ family response regulator
MTQKGQRPPAAGTTNGIIVLQPREPILASSKLLVVVDRRELVRGCVVSWISTFGQEFDLANVADVSASLPAATLARASVVILSANAPNLADGWLEGQVAWLRANRADVPIVAIVEPDEVGPVGKSVVQLRLHGYIPTSTSMEVAAAALRLVAAGGIYFPHARDGDQAPPANPPGPTQRSAETARAGGLTPREWSVLQLLERGMANKIIAYRLGLSQSTVKAHVHNIISKLKVRNRTEAAMTAQRLQPATTIERIPENAIPERSAPQPVTPGFGVLASPSLPRKGTKFERPAGAPRTPSS